MSNYDQFSSEELLQVIEEYGRAEAEKERERIIALLRRAVTYYTKKARAEESAPRKFIAANTIKEVIAVIEEGEK